MKRSVRILWITTASLFFFFVLALLFAYNGLSLERANERKCNKISEHAINALITMEDVDFYNHSGIRFNDVINLPLFFLIGKGKHKSPTLTVQLSRNLLRDLKGAMIQEYLFAIKLERYFTKQEILDLYLNTARFTDNIIGIEKAAFYFFGKDAAHLSLEEAATLIGMLRGTNLYNPRRNPKISLLRRNVVIGQMEKRNFITEEEAKAAINTPIILSAR